nr:hypothetical transcript [Hymenolepis microstoma]
MQDTRPLCHHVKTFKWIYSHHFPRKLLVVLLFGFECDGRSGSCKLVSSYTVNLLSQSLTDMEELVCSICDKSLTARYAGLSTCDHKFHLSCLMKWSSEKTINQGQRQICQCPVTNCGRQFESIRILETGNNQEFQRRFKCPLDRNLLSKICVITWVRESIITFETVYRPGMVFVNQIGRALSSDFYSPYLFLYLCICLSLTSVNHSSVPLHPLSTCCDLDVSLLCESRSQLKG